MAVPYWVSKAQRVICDQFLTLEDLKEAIFSMEDDKALGCDGFPYEFIKPCGLLLVPTCTRFIWRLFTLNIWDNLLTR